MARLTGPLLLVAFVSVLNALIPSMAITAKQQEDAPCRLGGDLQVEPASVQVSDMVSVTLTADYLCAKRQIAVGFGTIDGWPDWRGAMLDEAAKWVRRVDLVSADVALVAYGPARVVQPLTDDRGQLINSMTRIPNENFIQPHRTIEQTRLELLRGRVASIQPDQALVILGDQIHTAQASDAMEQADLAKAAGIEFYAVGVAPYYRQLVSSPRHLFESTPFIVQSAADATSKVFRAIDKTIGLRGFASSVVTATVPSGLRYVAGSSVPAARWEPQERVLVWSHARPNDVITMTFQALADVCGTVSVGDGSHATGLDLAGQAYRHDYVGQPIDILCPTVTPTATTTPSATPTPTAPPTFTSSPTRSPGSVYLPLALREECFVGLQHVDVALVIDASTSMLEPTREGRTKLAAAVAAVRLFVGELDLPPDQAAVVEFNGGVRLLQGLTGSRADLEAALNRIAVQQQTRIDLGVETAHGELMSQRHRAGNERVMIVLTDGRANPVGPEVAVEKAQAAKGDGVTIFSIGLGEELDLEALTQIASKPAYFYRAPDAEDLADIYKAIAIEIPCPAGDSWPGR